MIHVVLLLKRLNLRYGVCVNGSFEHLRYEGAEEISWRADRNWKGFWEYVKGNIRMNDWKELRLSILHRDCSWTDLIAIVDYPMRKGIGGFRIQSVQEVLPELACKGMLLRDKPVRFRWEDLQWEVSAVAVDEVAGNEGLPPLEITDDQLLHYFAAPWPLKREMRQAPTHGLESMPRSPLPDYIQSSKKNQHEVCHECFPF